MTDNEASPAHAALPAAHAAAAHPHHPSGDHAIGRQPADLPLTVVRKTVRYAPVLLGGVAAAGAKVSALQPPFPDFKTGTFYGPDTPYYNPDTIPAGQVRAVGSYQVTSSSSFNTLNHGLIYLGPVNGAGGSWTTIDVPSDGSNTVNHVRACPVTQPDCFVLNTIVHSTMGNLVVGNYDLNLGHGVSGNAFIYNMATHQWTLLQLGGSLSSGTTLYGIWQNGGPGSPNYTLAGGSSAHLSSLRTQRAFLMNYNERTGRFGPPRFYSYGNAPTLATHFDGITKVPGGYNLATISSAQQSSMAFIPAIGDYWPVFGAATWYPINVAPLCSGTCGMVTANTVYQNKVMGLYVIPGNPNANPPTPTTQNTYLATVPPGDDDRAWYSGRPGAQRPARATGTRSTSRARVTRRALGEIHSRIDSATCRNARRWIADPDRLPSPPLSSAPHWGLIPQCR